MQKLEVIFHWTILKAICTYVWALFGQSSNNMSTWRFSLFQCFDSSRLRLGFIFYAFIWGRGNFTKAQSLFRESVQFLILETQWQNRFAFDSCDMKEFPENPAM